MADAPKSAAPTAKQDWIPILVLIILLAGAGGFTKHVNETTDSTPVVATPVVPVATTTVATTYSYTNPKYGFLFSYPTTLFIHERANGVILLPTQAFPDIASEVYSLGRYVILTKNPMIGPYERTVTKTEFVKNITTEDNMFEGKPTKVTWEKSNGLDMLRIEHMNQNAPHTLNYYVFKGENYYNIQMHPYGGVDLGSREYSDFMTVVRTFVLARD